MGYGYGDKITIRTKFLNFFRSLFFLPILEKFLLRYSLDSDYGSLVSKFIPNHYQYKIGSVRTVSRDGVNYKLDLSDLVDWYIYFGFKDGSKDIVYSMVEEGFYVLDIGANMGDLGFSFSKLVGDTGRVYCFEPDSSNFDRLRKNFSLNNFNNIRLINKGIGQEPGLYVMEANTNEPGNDGSKRIVSTKKKINSLPGLAEIIRLDDWVHSEMPARIDLIKMDIEGYEYSALSSARLTLEKYKPVLYLELHDVKLREHGSSAIELCNLIESLGYNIFDADNNTKINITDDLFGIHDDIVCYKSNTV